MRSSCSTNTPGSHWRPPRAADLFCRRDTTCKAGSHARISFAFQIHGCACPAPLDTSNVPVGLPQLPVGTTVVALMHFSRSHSDVRGWLSDRYTFHSTAAINGPWTQTDTDPSRAWHLVVAPAPVAPRVFRGLGRCTGLGPLRSAAGTSASAAPRTPIMIAITGVSAALPHRDRLVTSSMASTPCVRSNEDNPKR